MAIIRRAYRDRGRETEQTPHFFVYYPMRNAHRGVGGLPGGALAVSMSGLDNHMPFLRYLTGDLVHNGPYRRLEAVLSKHAPDLAPPALKLLVVAVFGRTYGLDVSGRRVSAEQLKEALFLDPEVAAAATGFFRAAQSGGQLFVGVQPRSIWRSCRVMATRSVFWPVPLRQAEYDGRESSEPQHGRD